MAPDTVLVSLALADGTVGIMAFVTCEYDADQPRWTRAATPEEIQKEITKASASFDANQLPVQGWRVIDRSELLDRTFRNAWVDSGKIAVDMPKAREIHRDHLREMRTPLLLDLDTAYMRADEAGDRAEKARIALRKQELRDVTTDPRIDTADTPEQLKAVRPAALGG